MEVNIFNLILYFMLYSFLGWVMESVFRSFCEKKIINTGFLIGPACPIYGLGSVILIAFMGGMQGKIIELFFMSVVVFTLWEYIVGVFLEKVFNTKYWDYSDHKINFQGRICLSNSIAWGFLGVGFINYIHPFIDSLVKNVPSNILHYIVYGSLAILIIDTIVTVIKTKNIKFKLKKVEELNEEIKQRIKELKEKVTDRTKAVDSIKEESEEKILDKNKIKEETESNKKQKAKNQKTKADKDENESVEELKTKRDKIMDSLYKYAYRIKQAFPAIKSKEITEILSNKLRFKKSNKEQENQVNDNEKEK